VRQGAAIAHHPRDGRVPLSSAALPGSGLKPVSRPRVFYFEPEAVEAPGAPFSSETIRFAP
jgi:hypothetical protein